jgi:hypothetical protein
MKHEPNPMLMLVVLLVVALTGAPLAGFFIRLIGGMFLAGWSYAARLFA